METSLEFNDTSVIQNALEKIKWICVSLVISIIVISLAVVPISLIAIYFPKHVDPETIITTITPTQEPALMHARTEQGKK